MKSNSQNDFYKEGYKSTLENANSHIMVANLAFEAGNYGIACSLNVLAAEESLKALFLILKHYNPNQNIDLDKVFRLHTFKHEQLKEVAKLDAIIQKSNEEIIKDLEIFIPVFDSMIEKGVPINNKLLNELKDDYNWFKKEREKQLNFDDISAWLNEANNDKNRGFYVDKRDNKWITPQKITQEKYLKDCKYTAAIFSYVSGVEELLLRAGKSAKDKNQISESSEETN